jgi:hypothetical protein
MTIRYAPFLGRVRLVSPYLAQDDLRVTSPSTPVEVQKSQEVRLFDVLVLGPFMIGMAIASRPPPLLRVLLGVAGAGTILYNLRNYQLTREQASAEASRNT